MKYRCLTLLTDYGFAGGLVGALHAVAFSIAPEVPVIDLDHSIPPQDVRLASLRLQRMLGYLPPGVHVAVVDPGVGTSRRAVALTTREHAFVGPDNGVLPSAALAVGDDRALLSAVVLDREAYWLSSRSATFDGRDVFVPVAAHLARGVELSDLGSPLPLDELETLAPPAVEVSADGRSARLEVLQVDSFGNVQLSGDAAVLETLSPGLGGLLSVEGGSGPPVHARVGRTFGDVAAGEVVVLVDSDGCIALSVNGGSAARLLGEQRPAALRLVKEQVAPPSRGSAPPS
ncbi:MAG: SAM-dependent chlorinase/fluorinase [Actinomycetota bacterium]|nr:SAM-dependent chlorinase/fluorinase [Actinomycetota bacterium]